MIISIERKFTYGKITIQFQINIAKQNILCYNIIGNGFQ